MVGMAHDIQSLIYKVAPVVISTEQWCSVSIMSSRDEVNNITMSARLQLQLPVAIGARAFSQHGQWPADRRPTTSSYMTSRYPFEPCRYLYAFILHIALPTCHIVTLRLGVELTYDFEVVNTAVTQLSRAQLEQHGGRLPDVGGAGQ